MDVIAKNIGSCLKAHGKPSDVGKTIASINRFCSLLRANKVKDSKEAFLSLHKTVQCIFLEAGWQILSHRTKYSEDSYKTAFLLFKLFRGKEMKELPIYNKMANLKTLDKLYKTAGQVWKKSGTSSSSSGVKKVAKEKAGKYDKKFQRYPSPDENDSLYIYYTTLLKQRPDSKLAVTWLTEHGLLEGNEREKIEIIYSKLKDKGKLIR